MAYGQIKENLKKNILIDDNTLLEYINTRISEENVKDLLLCINITNYGESCYNPNDNQLCINTEEFYLENIDDNIPDLLKLIPKKDKDSFKLENPNLGNIYNLYTINHEINHLVQKKEVLNSNNTLEKYLFLHGKIEEFIDDRFFKSFYYYKYHDRFYNEYNANINAYEEVISLLKAYNLKTIEKDLIKANKIISKHILYLYSDLDENNKYSTPLKNSLKIYKHLLETSKKHNVEFDLDINIINYIKNEKPTREIDKLLLGFSINKDTHNYLKRVSSGKIKTLNLFDDISY